MSLKTAPDFHSEENPIITYSIDSNVVSAEAGIFNSSGTQSYVPYRALDKTKTSYTFQLTDGEINNFIRAMESSTFTVKNTLTIRFYIRTTLSSGEYRYSYLTRTFSVERPTLTATVEDVNEKTVALTGDNQKLIRYYSNAKVTANAVAKRGAAINEDFYIIRTVDENIYAKTHTFNNVEYDMYLITAEDSLGSIDMVDLRPEMVDYIKPTCNIGDSIPDALGNTRLECNGIFFNSTFGAVVNTLTVQCRYAKMGDTFKDDWIDMQVFKNGDSYTASANFTITDFDRTQIYVFEARATDELEIIEASPYRAKNKPLFHWGEDDFVFEVPVTFKGTGEQTFSSDLRLKDNANYGKYLRFGDGDYCYIAELTDDVMTIKANRINLVANGVYVDDYAIPILQKGVWTPTLNVTPSSYTTQYGWYSKMGQTVTIGFYIKATCYSGYHTTSISISGVPFNPMFSAAGGGMCSGAYISGGFDFQCFVVETNNRITTRVQACNNTTATNLSTSATGCNYRSGGGEITLSGTITYIANS